MAFKKLIFTPLAALVLFAACKKVDIEGQEPDVYPIVVEAVMSDLAPLEVTVSRAVPFSQPGPVPEAATVTVSDGSGNSEPLIQWETGRFSGAMKAVPAEVYTLEILADEGRFDAKTQAPSGRLVIDMVTAQRQSDTLITLMCQLQLPPSRPVYARLKVFIDGFLWEDFFLEKTLEQQAVFTQEIELNYVFPGSRATVEVLTLPKPAYEFYRAIGTNSLGTNFNPGNAKNPPSNLVGGAIGFFSVALADTTSLEIW